MDGIMKEFLRILGAVVLCCGAAACRAASPEHDTAKANTIVFKHGVISGGESALRALLGEFEREHPGTRIVDESLPSSTDDQHQFYAINLGGHSATVDVLAADI